MREAERAQGRGITVLATVVATHQMAQATLAEQAIAQMLDEQGIDTPAEALLALLAFTTPADRLGDMASATTTPAEFARLIASLVQDAGRAAQGVAIAARPDVGWVRQLTPPSCSRCVPLAGRVYRYSDGFLRHPNDDCVTIPVREDDPTLTVNPVEMLRSGQVRGLSKADTAAILDGADFNQVVNVSRKAAGLTEAGQALVRAGRPTPAGVYRLASDRAEALELLQRFGYLR